MIKFLKKKENQWELAYIIFLSIMSVVFTITNLYYEEMSLFYNNKFVLIAMGVSVILYCYDKINENLHCARLYKTLLLMINIFLLIFRLMIITIDGGLLIDNFRVIMLYVILLYMNLEVVQ